MNSNLTPLLPSDPMGDALTGLADRVAQMAAVDLPEYLDDLDGQPDWELLLALRSLRDTMTGLVMAVAGHNREKIHRALALPPDEPESKTP